VALFGDSVGAFRTRQAIIVIIILLIDVDGKYYHYWLLMETPWMILDDALVQEEQEPDAMMDDGVDLVTSDDGGELENLVESITSALLRWDNVLESKQFD
jgi:hypothetical protein